MTLWLAVAAAIFAAGGGGAWFLSSRPILYTRLFVSYEDRMVVRREILEDPRFGTRWRGYALLQFLIAAGCMGAAFLLRA